MDRPQGRGLDGAAPRPGAGACATRLGGAEADWLVGAGAASPAPAGGHGRRPGGIQKKLDEAVAQAKAARPERPVEVWAEDERRLGLRPVRRRVWAPIGERPTALGHHRHQWLHVTASVQPTTGEAVWCLSTGLSKPLFAAPLAAFAREVGAGRERRVVLVLDNAGWHGPKGLAVPDGVTLVFLPPHSPELQPAERLWPLVDEPVANRHFATLADLDAVVAERCRRLDAAMIKPHTNFHWWPKSVQPS
jgi:transposase